MIKNKRAIYYLITIVALIFPIGFLLNVISAKVAFPMMYFLMGLQQVYHGLFMTPHENKKSKKMSIIFGVLLIVFSVVFVIPQYYF